MAERSPVKRLMNVRLILFPQLFVMNEFDDEEIRYQSVFITNEGCFGRAGLCITLKTGLRRFESFGHHR